MVDDLVSHVYGPYPDYIFLKDPQRTGLRLPLRDVELYCGPQRIGFDQSEYITNPPISSPLTKNSTVTFFGVLEIYDLDLLSEKGIEYLEHDLKEYDQKIHIKHITGTTSWDIQKLHRQVKAEGRLLKARVGCTKNLLAHYLTTDKDFDKLLIYSRNQNVRRTYWVKSLNVQTFRQSRQFLDRYRLRALIVELCENDPDNTPLHKRDIDFLIRRYFADMRPRDRDGDRRIISAVGLDPSVACEPRHLRHISRAEIRSRFAEQAEWLLANQIASNGPNTKLVDIPQWIKFCREAWSDSLEARLENVKWGLGRSRDDSNSYDLAQRLAEYGQTATFWAQQLKNIDRREYRATKKRKQSSPEMELAEDLLPIAAPAFQYDSDFSEPTTSESSDSDSDSRPLMCPRNGIPGFVHEPPHITSGHFTWHCQGCKHTINLLDIPSDYLSLLPPETVHVIKHTRSWRINDGPIKEALYLMVSNHYMEHHLISEDRQFLMKTKGVQCLEEIKTGPQFSSHIKTEENP